MALLQRGRDPTRLLTQPKGDSMSRRQQRRKDERRRAHQKGQRGNRRYAKGWRDHDNERGIDAKDIYVDVLFGVKAGRIDG